jgi:hypothetical protein
MMFFGTIFEICEESQASDWNYQSRKFMFFLAGTCCAPCRDWFFLHFLVRVRIGYSILRRIVLLCCSLKLIIIFIFCSFWRLRLLVRSGLIS